MAMSSHEAKALAQRQDMGGDMGQPEGIPASLESISASLESISASLKILASTVAPESGVRAARIRTE